MNETLLNLSLLEKQFNKHFEDKYVLKYWFTKLLHSSTVMGIMGAYRDFGELAAVALEQLFYENDLALSQETKNEILGAFKKLPAYNDVRPALQLLRANDIRVIAISNSSLDMIKEQLSNAEIIALFDSYYSVDDVSKYKPFEDIYLKVAQQEDLKREEIVMVATHDWDLFGAKKAGLSTAYISRKKEKYHPLYTPADFTDSNMTDLMQQIFDLKR